MQEQNDIPPQPAKEAKERRSVLMPIRWKPSEIKELDSLAASAGADVSEYVRAAALRKRIKPGNIDRLALVQLLGELGKIGSNVNQIARSINQGNDVAAGAITRAANAVEQCADQVRHILSNGKL